MPLTTPQVSVSQSALTPANITIVDDSVGSDVNIVSRRVSFQTAEGTYITTTGASSSIAYEAWAYADVNKTWTLLTEDMALLITVQWLDISGNVLYTYSNFYPLTKFNKNFAVYLGQLQALSPGILQDNNYVMNMATFWAYITYSIVMIEEAADISSSQNLMNKATLMRLNESKYF